MGEKNHRRRDVLKATGGILGGLAIGGVAATPASAQSTYFRYDRVRVRLVDVDSAPPRFLTVESPLYLTQALLEECDADHPCSIDVLDYRRDDDDDDDDFDDDADDAGDDDDGSCPGYASVVLLCHADDESDAVVLTGLIRDVLTEHSDQGVDFAVSLSPTSATNVDSPRSVSNPCPGGGDGQGDDDSDDDTGDDDADDNGNDDNGDDDNDDNNDDDDNGDN